VLTHSSLRVVGRLLSGGKLTGPELNNHINGSLYDTLRSQFPFEFSHLQLYLTYPLLAMSTLEDLDDLEREQKEEDKKDDSDKNKKADQKGDAEMKDAEPEEKEEDPIDEEIYNLSTNDILTRRRLLENDSRIMKSEFQRLTHEKATMGEKIKDNLDKIENNRYMHLIYAVELSNF